MTVETAIEQNQRLLIIDTLSELIRSIEMVGKTEITVQELKDTRSGMIGRYNAIQEKRETESIGHSHTETLAQN